MQHVYVNNINIYIKCHYWHFITCQSVMVLFDWSRKPSFNFWSNRQQPTFVTRPHLKVVIWIGDSSVTGQGDSSKNRFRGLTLQMNRFHAYIWTTLRNRLYSIWKIRLFVGSTPSSRNRSFVSNFSAEKPDCTLLIILNLNGHTRRSCKLVSCV